MIKIISAKGNPLIIASVSDVADSMGYCELRIKYFLQGRKPPQTQVTMDGEEAHQKVAEYEKKHFTFEPITQEKLHDIQTDMEFPFEGLFTRFLFRMNVGGQDFRMLVIGQADKVARSKEMLIVEDFKYPLNLKKYDDVLEPYDDHKLQAMLYLNSCFTKNPDSTPKEWFQIPHKEKVWIINVKDKQTQKSIRIFKGVQNKEAEDFLRDKLSRFVLIAMGILEPEHHSSLSKCRACRSADYCEYKLLG